MKFNRFFSLILACHLAVAMFCLPVCGAEPSTAPETSASVQEETDSGSSNRWIFFLITSGLSLAVAVPLAIRSGNKKYGK